MGNPFLESSAAIAVEHTGGPILLISGNDDGVWRSTEMSEAVMRRLKEDHFAYAYLALEYPHAGHRAGRPEVCPLGTAASETPPRAEKKIWAGAQRVTLNRRSMPFLKSWSFCARV
jgi:BAAT / Acyl-CoA thioester hydrolase C terminal